MAGNKRFCWSDVRAGEILPEVYRAYEEKRGYYGLAHHTYRPNINPGKIYAPQHEFRPESAAVWTVGHRIFQAVATGLDYRSSSRGIYRTVGKLWEKKPWMFSMEHVAEESRMVALTLKIAGHNFPDQGATRLLNISRTIHDIGGDPVDIFGLGRSIDEIQRYRKEAQKERPYFLNGYGPKLLSLLAVIFEDFGYVREIPGAFPVDKHVQSIMLSLGVVKVIGTEAIDTAELAEFIRKRIYQFCLRRKLQPLFLSHALWFLGNGVCTRCFALRGRGGGELERLCPVAETCGGPKYASFPYSLRGVWDPKVDVFGERPKREGSTRFRDVQGSLF